MMRPKSDGRKWTEEEINYLLENMDAHARETAKKLGRTISSVKNRRIKLRMYGAAPKKREWASDTLCDSCVRCSPNLCGWIGCGLCETMEAVERRMVGKEYVVVLSGRAILVKVKSCPDYVAEGSQ